MARKSVKIWYWVTTILFVAFMIFSGITELARVESSDALFESLGYPLYLSYILGIAKILGGVALIQTKWYVIKEWAYAGFAFDLIGATFSFVFAGGFTFVEMVMPLVILAVMFVSYSLWKKLY